MNDDLGRRKKALEGLLDEARKLVGNSVKRSFEVLFGDGGDVVRVELYAPSRGVNLHARTSARDVLVCRVPDRNNQPPFVRRSG